MNSIDDLRRFRRHFYYHFVILLLSDEFLLHQRNTVCHHFLI
nr:MAG TPA: hypothetical protein [Caudoviricetes sp.]